MKKFKIFGLVLVLFCSAILTYFNFNTNKENVVHATSFNPTYTTINSSCVWSMFNSNTTSSQLNNVFHLSNGQSVNTFVDNGSYIRSASYSNILTINKITINRLSNGAYRIICYVAEVGGSFYLFDGDNLFDYWPNTLFMINYEEDNLFQYSSEFINLYNQGVIVQPLLSWTGSVDTTLTYHVFVTSENYSNLMSLLGYNTLRLYYSDNVPNSSSFGAYSFVDVPLSQFTIMYDNGNILISNVSLSDFTSSSDTYYYWFILCAKVLGDDYVGSYSGVNTEYYYLNVPIYLNTPVLTYNYGRLEWASVENATSYEIRIYVDGNYYYEDISITTRVVSGNGTYSVRAVDSTGVYEDSNWSNSIIVDTFPNDNGDYSFYSLFSAIADSQIYLIRSMLNYEIWGINFYYAFGVLLFVGLIMFVFKIFKKSEE